MSWRPRSRGALLGALLLLLACLAPVAGGARYEEEEEAGGGAALALRRRPAWQPPQGQQQQQQLGDSGDDGYSLVIHLVPHSHVPRSVEADPSETVSSILSRVLDQLDADLARRFVWADVALFRHWYESLAQADKDRVRRVVSAGQLEVVGVGLVEHDEVLASWESVVDSATASHWWLESHLGVRPRVAWQMEGADHSDATPALLSALGYDALIINRVHYRVKQQLRQDKHLEFLWSPPAGGQPQPQPKPKPKLARQQQPQKQQQQQQQNREQERDQEQQQGIFTHVLLDGFAMPEGFDFESGKGVRQVTNAKRRADRLLSALRERAAAYRTHHLLVPMGDALRFQDAALQFTNMEKLQRHVEDNVPDVKLRFSTASEYVRAARQAAAETRLELPLLTGDLLPFADGKDGYWTGAYSTRQSLKAVVRRTEDVVRDADTWFALGRARAGALGDAPRVAAFSQGRVEPDLHEPAPEWAGGLWAALERARSAAALAAGPAVVGGASRQAVVTETLSRLRDAQADALAVIEHAVAAVLTKRESEAGGAGQRVRPSLTAVPFSLLEPGVPEAEAGAGAGAGRVAPSEAAAQQHPVIVTNPHAVWRLKVVHLSVGSDWNALRHVQVVDSAGKPVPAQLTHQLLQRAPAKGGGAGKANQRPAGKRRGAKHQEHGQEQAVMFEHSWTSRIMLSFVARVPPLGVTTYFVFLASARERIKVSHLAGAAAPVTQLLAVQRAEVSADAKAARAEQAAEDAYYAEDEEKTGKAKAAAAAAGVGGAGGEDGDAYYAEDAAAKQAATQAPLRKGAPASREAPMPLDQGVQQHSLLPRAARAAVEGSGAAPAAAGTPLADGIELLGFSERTVTLENALLSVTLSSATGLLQSIADKRTQRSTLLRQQFLRYSGARSGAAVFAPDAPPREVDMARSTVAFTRGPVFDQLQVLGADGVGQIVRVYKAAVVAAAGDPAAGQATYDEAVDLLGHVEVVHFVAAELGMDTVVRYDTSMDSGGAFYTDNPLGRLVKRQVLADAPTASGVFPAAAAAALRDSQATAATRQGQVLAVVARSPFGCGGRSAADSGTGALELHLHRNHEGDDGRAGLGEPLSDFGPVEFVSLLAVGTPAEMLGWRLGHLRARALRPGVPLFALEAPEIAALTASREQWAARFLTEVTMLARPVPALWQLALRARDAAGDLVVVRVANGGAHDAALPLSRMFATGAKVAAVYRCSLTGAVQPVHELQAHKTQTQWRAAAHPSGLREPVEYMDASPGALAAAAPPDSLPDAADEVEDEDGNDQEDSSSSQQQGVGARVGATIDSSDAWAAEGRLQLGPNRLRVPAHGAAAALVSLRVLQEDELPLSMYDGERGPQPPKLAERSSAELRPATSVLGSFAGAAASSGGAVATASALGEGAASGPAPIAAAGGAGTSASGLAAAFGGSLPTDVAAAAAAAARMTREQLEAAAAASRTESEAMQRRVAMYKSNIDTLLADIDRFKKQGNVALREATIGHLRAAELAMQESQARLEAARRDLALVRTQLAALSGSGESGSLIFQDEAREREFEAAVHGAASGAAAMLIVLVAANWAFARGLKLIKAYVPVTFAGKSSREALPTMKVN
jgi:hypothetical protein